LNTDFCNNVCGLIDRIVQELRKRQNDTGDVLSRLAEQEIGAHAFRAPASKTLAACRHLPALLGQLATTHRSLAAAIAAVAGELAWRQNQNYSDRAMGQPGYMENYAYAEIIGPSGTFEGDDFLLGLMILGPNLHYRDHFHSAPELYWTLTGPSEWRCGIGDFTSRAADETIWHPSLVPHATRTGTAALLTVWAWTRDVAAAARLVSP
jgi:hypothetical protein